MKKVYTIILIFLNTSVFAQSNCERNLQEAKSDYNAGNLYAIPGKLTDCLEEGFSKNEKIEAYRLLTLTYLNINQNEKAKESLIKLLNIKTDYRVQLNVDPPELYSLYRKIDTDPQYFIGAIIGINYNTIQVLKDEEFTMESNRGAHDKNFSGLNGYQAGAQFILPVLNNLWLKAAILYQNQRYDFNLTNTIYQDLDNSDNTEFTNYKYTSVNNGVNLHLSGRSIINNYYWKPFVEYGISGRYNINHLFLEYESLYSEEPDLVTIEEINMNQYRKQFNFGFHLHMGSMFKIGEYYGEFKIGASKFLLAHANYDNANDLKTNTIGGQFEIVDTKYNNLIYEVNLSFNIPFFNFK